jgi:hypothetical protein
VKLSPELHVRDSTMPPSIDDAPDAPAAAAAHPLSA